MPAFGLRPEYSIIGTMKRLGLTPLSASATLFLALQSVPVPAQDKVAHSPADPTAAAMGPRLQELVVRFDKDGDGNLDAAEMAALKEAMKQEPDGFLPQPRDESPPAGPEAFRRRMLEMFDRNGDGRLDEGERAAAQKFAAERGLGPGGETRPEILKRFDRNGNGKIDDDERPALQEFLRGRLMRPPEPANREQAERGALENVLRAAINGNPAVRRKFDENGDGKLDDLEWAAARKKIAGVLGETLPPAPGSPEAKRRMDAVAAELTRRRQASLAGADTVAPAK